MNIDSTLETIAARLPEELSKVIADARGYLPVSLELDSVAKFLLFFAAGSLILSLLGRFILGKRSSLNHSLSAVMAILFVYAVTVIVYTFNPWNLDDYLSPLPFVTFFNDYMVVIPIVGANPTVLARELLSLIILAFLVNLLDTFMPQGKSVIGWYFLRFLTVGLSMAVHFVTVWGFSTYLPEVLVRYAPLILLLVLIGMLLMGFLNAVLGIMITISNPILGVLYGFFFSNIIGKQVTKSVFTSGVLGLILYLIDHFEYSFIQVSPSALSAYGPLATVCLVLWYLIGHLL